MGGRRRRKRPVIGRVPGQKGRVVIEPSELVIDRKADKVIVHDEAGRQTRTMPGREQHIHLQTGRQPRPERPTIDFDVLKDALMRRSQKFCTKHAVNIGLGGDIEREVKGHLQEAEYSPKFRGKTGIIRNFVDVRSIIMDKWNGIHPLKLIETIGSRKKGGLTSYRKTRKRVEMAKKLREKYAPEFKKVYEQYKAETEQAILDLRKAFESGKVTWENYNWHMEKYEEALKKAEYNFVLERMKLMDAHNKEWNAT